MSPFAFYVAMATLSSLGVSSSSAVAVPGRPTPTAASASRGGKQQQQQEQQQGGGVDHEDRDMEAAMAVGDKHRPELTIGLILPHTSFGVRDYLRAINNAVASLSRSRGRKLVVYTQKYRFTQKQVHSTMMKLTPSPTGEDYDLLLDQQTYAAAV